METAFTFHKEVASLSKRKYNRAKTQGDSADSLLNGYDRCHEDLMMLHLLGTCGLGRDRRHCHGTGPKANGNEMACLFSL